ncbi:hypothetical protein [Oscillibacter valericigenes]|uniref:hypothetical protein n=1 Tax=Oscillibacter valericigenes TaxID=351091 RepID=UPI0019568FE8|nr:hypothetical protein [Oscillibacter valericigenes]MBM6909849.1 hypothetical protein [Oscillibacter valericigenes]
MELLKWELRKTWRPGILAAILLLGAVYYWMFPQFYIEYFCNGPYAEAQFTLVSDWVAQYGPTLEQAERAELDGQLAEELDVFAQQIAAIPEAVTAGLTDYEAVLSFRENYLDGTRENGGEADMDVEALLYRVYGGTSWYTIAVLEQAMEAYDTQAERRTQAVSNRREAGQPEAMVRREAELASSEMAHSLLPSSVKHSTQEYGKDLAVRCVLSIVLLLSPTLVRDRLRNTRPLQWASRRGRTILSTQMGTALLSALVLTAVNVSVYAVPFLAQGPLRFAACGLDGIWEWGTPWFDWSYGTYLLVLVGLLLALSLGAAGLTVFLSQYSGSYIAMLLKAVPLFVAVGAVLGTWLLDMPFTFRNLGNGAVWLPRGIEAVTAGVLLALGLSLCILSCRQQKRRELL